VSLLLDADAVIHSERPAQYGPASESFARIARAFNAFRPGREEIAAGDVALLLVAMKLVRNGYSPGNRDHRLDAAGYLGLFDDIQGAP
jgi:hypothetical protein